MDDICGIKHAYYFAYGSNMFPERLHDRIKKHHTAFPATLPNYLFTYNKKSVDGTAKANIKPNNGTEVQGVCFEIDEEDFEILTQCEGGYDRRNIEVNIENGNKTKTVTYISSSIDETLKSSNEYKKLILQGAEYWNINHLYISEYLK